MSNKYSIGGYRIAVQARTFKTVLVEGKDDKELFDSLKLSWCNEPRLNIDTPEIFSDDALTGMGAKARIDYFISQLSQPSSIKDKLCCFVDREWEELVDSQSLDPLPWSAPILTDIRLKTAGHSIENYGFNADFVVSYLKHFGQAVATESLISEVRSAVPELLKAGAAFSEVARKRQLLKRCTNIVDLADIDWIGSRVSLSTQIEHKLVARGAQSVSGLIADYSREYSGKWSRTPLCDEGHLHAHGHLGETILWLGIGRIAVNQGFSTTIGEEIALGRRDERRRVWHGWLSNLAPTDFTPIDRALCLTLATGS